VDSREDATKAEEVSQAPTVEKPEKYRGFIDDNASDSLLFLSLSFNQGNNSCGEEASRRWRSRGYQSMVDDKTITQLEKKLVQYLRAFGMGPNNNVCLRCGT
jgi:hypothetical protein